MSVVLRTEIVDPGNSSYVSQAWELKEEIREQEGVLRQDHWFFVDSYTEARVYCLVDDDDTLRGFAAMRDNGYLMFLAVAPTYQGEGFGELLLREVVETYPVITCHVRVTNEDALGFYEHLGFRRVHREERYYEDGGDAYYMSVDRERLLETLATDEE